MAGAVWLNPRMTYAGSTIKKREGASGQNRYPLESATCNNVEMVVGLQTALAYEETSPKLQTLDKDTARSVATG